MKKIAIVSNGNIDGRKFENFDTWCRAVDLTTKSLNENLYAAIRKFEDVEFKHYIEFNSNDLEKTKPLYDIILNNLDIHQPSLVKTIDECYEIIHNECGINLLDYPHTTCAKMTNNVFQYYFFIRRCLQILRQEPDTEIFIRARADIFYFDQRISREFLYPTALNDDSDVVPASFLRTLNLRLVSCHNPKRNLCVADQFFSINRAALNRIRENISLWVNNLLQEFIQAKDDNNYSGMFPETSLGQLVLMSNLDCRIEHHNIRLAREHDSDIYNEILKKWDTRM